MSQSERVVVLGGAGFIGKRLVALLAEAGDVSDVDMLRSWGIDGYATQENAS